MDTNAINQSVPQNQDYQSGAAAASTSGASAWGMPVQPHTAQSAPAVSGVNSFNTPNEKFIRSRFACVRCLKKEQHSYDQHVDSSKSGLNQIETIFYNTLVNRFRSMGFNNDTSARLAMAKMRVNDNAQITCLFSNFSNESYSITEGLEACRKHCQSELGRGCMHHSQIPVCYFLIDTYEDENFKKAYGAMVEQHPEHAGLVIEMAGNGIVYNGHKRHLECRVCDKVISSQLEPETIKQHVGNDHPNIPGVQTILPPPITDDIVFETVVESDTLPGHAFALIKKPETVWSTDLCLGDGVNKDLSFIIKYFTDEPEKCAVIINGLSRFLFVPQKRHIKSHRITSDQCFQIEGLAAIKKEATDAGELAYSSLSESCNTYVSELASLASIPFPGELTDNEMRENPCAIFLLNATNMNWAPADRARQICEKGLSQMSQIADKQPLIDFLARQPGFKPEILHSEAELRRALTKCFTEYIHNLLAVPSTSKRFPQSKANAMDWED